MTLEGLEDFWWTYKSLVISIGINGLLGLSVYLVLAMGQLFLAQAAFMAIGAYASAIATLYMGFPFPLAVLFGVSLSLLTALIIAWPMLRLTGVYLGIGSIAFGEVVRAVGINSPALGGALGLSGIPQKASALTVFVSLAVAIVICIAIVKSKIGRALDAIRTDEVVARVLGIHTFRYKLAATLGSAIIAGYAGALSAHAHSAINPAEFSFDASVTILSFAILGGTGSPIGAVVGSAILTLLPEVLRTFRDYRMMIDGLVIVAVVAFRPDGLLSWRMLKVRKYAAR